jgi:hypothetical protein
VHASRDAVTTRHCWQCNSEGHARDATYCKDCGSELVPSSQAP